MKNDSPTTQLCRYDETDIYVRERNLCKEVIGQMSFTDFLYLQIMGKPCGPIERAVIDAALVTLCEHGLTPSAIATRLTYYGAPESLQGAIAAGLLGVGSQFVGTMENCAKVLQEIMDSKEPREKAARDVVARFRADKKLLPGFGHPHHRPDDPRPAALFAAGRAAGVSGHCIAALETLSGEVDSAFGRHITINATGAIAALMLEINVPPVLMRGFAVLSRAAGLIGHIYEEQRNPGGPAIWKAADKAVPYAAE
jgi:citrate synthase